MKPPNTKNNNNNNPKKKMIKNMIKSVTQHSHFEKKPNK